MQKKKRKGEEHIGRRNDNTRADKIGKRKYTVIIRTLELT